MEVYKDFKRYNFPSRCSIVAIKKGISRSTFFISIEYNKNVYYNNDN